MAHPIAAFSEHLATLPAARYPAGVVPLTGCLRGTAFFSAAAGLYWPDPWAPMPKFPTGGVMLVAHNLDGADAFQARLEQGTPHGDPRFPRRLMPTWRNLYDLLGAAGVSRENCFFTNAYVGLNGQGVIGPFAGSRDQQFSAWCRDFLTMQIAAMQPGAVIALGVDARRFMSGMADDLRPWRRSGDPASLTLTLAGVETTVVSVSHPARVQTGEARAADARTLSMALPPRIF